MIVCITEKPSVARDIARILGATTRREGYIEGNGYCVTWTFGHLCCLKDPDDYTPMWKKWSLSALPMIPDRFGIKLIPEASYESQFNVIKNLCDQADEVINCGDAGQEGELIQRWVMQKAAVKCPVRRLWISSLTDASIRKGFSELKPQSDYDNLYFAGLSRAIGDWVLGMNATRLYTLRYASMRGTVLSVGRVQTPTLAMIVSRHREILNFKPEDYFELRTLYREAVFSSTEGKIKNAEDADRLLESIKDRLLKITDVQEKTGREAPPRLFDLTSLQVECNRRWGWSADDSLKLIQSLYEKKVTTYPRVDTTYLPDDVYPKVPSILRNMTPYASLTASLLEKPLPKTKKVFDNSKVTDHHAIIPTGESPSSLVGNERQMYHLIAMRFIMAFYPDCNFATTTVLADIDGHGFKATGKVIVEPGWRALLQKDETPADSQGEDSAVLPRFTVGECGPHKPSVVKKSTQPPKPYTEGTLLRAMETAGRNIDEEELREAMKANGIGRPSTRAAIIETLFKRHYISRERKNIVPTEAGISLIDIIRQDLLKSPKLTGIWENRLRRIERGDYSAAEFIDALKQMTTQVVQNVFADNSMQSIAVDQSVHEQDTKSKTAKKKTEGKQRAKRVIVKNLSDIKCPLCGQGVLLKGRTAYGCSHYASGCALKLPFEQYGSDLTPSQLSKLIRKQFKK